ncbi:hypothetical protein C1645_819981 [Glomus cerebriforme]|uniref:Uncharacterized protein n=1 Tax=Glomus cerebriforme TaxID=658196 RepID=A0A397T825_9GLOM|nr:hypothetical protein C1645_819981 [Glomus cerebriforme]
MTHNTSNNNSTIDNLPPNIQPEPNIYNDADVSCDYTVDLNDTSANNNDNNQSYMFPNENVASPKNDSHTPSLPQYDGQQILYQNSPQSNGIDSPQTNNPEILGFDIPGFKVIIIPISSPMSLNMTSVYSQDIPGFKIIIIPVISSPMQNQLQQDHNYSYSRNQGRTSE